MHSWRVLILPFMEQRALYEHFLNDTMARQVFDALVTKAGNETIPNF